MPADAGLLSLHAVQAQFCPSPQDLQACQRVTNWLPP
jgi:hypothetical protein